MTPSQNTWKIAKNCESRAAMKKRQIIRRTNFAQQIPLTVPYPACEYGGRIGGPGDAYL